MKRLNKFIISLIAVSTLLSVAVGQEQNSPLIPVMQEEMQRNLNGLHLEGLQRPFYISYRIQDTKRLRVLASVGGLAYSELDSNRLADPLLLVGNYDKNNSNFNVRYYNILNGIEYENEPRGVATAMWSSFDNLYKNAAEMYNAKQAVIAQQERDAAEKSIPDWEKKAPTTLHLPKQKAYMDQTYWNDYALQASNVTIKYDEIAYSSVSVTVLEGMQYACNTEGSQFSLPTNYYTVVLSLESRTKDGQNLNDNLTISSTSFERMPTLAKFKDTCEIFIKRFLELRNAPLIKDVYIGPVMYEGEAFASLFRRNFVGAGPIADGPLIARRPPVNSNQRNRIEMLKDKKLISRSLTIKSLSGTPVYKGIPLDGYFPIDATGVIPDKELTLVENGVLRNQLNGRIPTPKFQHSNGHARMALEWVSYGSIFPGNVQLTSNSAVAPEKLKQELLAAAKEEDLDYAYIIRGQGNIAYAYRVYVADGHEELVRGAIVPSADLKEFKRVIGASDKEQISNVLTPNGIATYILPQALVFEELEVTKTNETFKKPYMVEKPKQ